MKLVNNLDGDLKDGLSKLHNSLVQNRLKNIKNLIFAVKKWKFFKIYQLLDELQQPAMKKLALKGENEEKSLINDKLEQLVPKIKQVFLNTKKTSQNKLN